MYLPGKIVLHGHTKRSEIGASAYDFGIEFGGRYWRWWRLL
jgi:hypothetical protein